MDGRVGLGAVGSVDPGAHPHSRTEVSQSSGFAELIGPLLLWPGYRHEQRNGKGKRQMLDGDHLAGAVVIRPRFNRRAECADAAA